MYEKPANQNNAVFSAASNSLVSVRWQTAQTPLSKRDHFYLQVTDIDPAPLNIRFDEEEKQLLVPMFTNDVHGPVDLMLIGQDGRPSQLAQNGVGYSKISGMGEGKIFCVDYASGHTLWRATGRTVVVCWKPEWLRTITGTFPAHPDNCIALDSNTCTQTDFADTWSIRSFPDSITNAMMTSLPFYMSTPAKNFLGLGVEGTAKILSLPPVSKAPVFLPDELDDIELSKSQETWLKELANTGDAKTAASLALSIGKRLLPQVPVKLSLSELRGLVEGSINQPVIHPKTLDNIWTELKRQLDLRRDTALMPVTMPKMVSTSHQLEICPSGLPTIIDYDSHGVTVVCAPTGSGKTQMIGRPLADWAAANGFSFLAICHRISLTTELAKRLALNNYIDQEPTHPDRGLAICLPSITNPKFESLVRRNQVLFIDEISQVLRFLTSDDCCRTSSATNEQVFERLKSLVANAHSVVVADASIDARTITFLETCRPGERFRIIDVPKPEDAGIQGVYYLGAKAQEHIAQQGLAELDSGGKIWIAAEAKKSVEVLEQIFVERGYRTLAIHSGNKGGKRQSRLLANADAESLYYDVVIASPVISSGISIQHESVPDNQRFTLGLYVGGGYTHTPVDAFQQLRRVRYLTEFVLGLRQLGKRGTEIFDCSSQIQAVRSATRLERRNQEITSFDHFVADIQAEEARMKKDFAAGLLWQLDAAGWRLAASSDHSQGSATNGQAQAKAAARAKDRYIQAMISAPVLNDSEAIELKRLRNRTEAQNVMLEAHTLRTNLGLGNVPITRELVEFWDHGRGIKKLDLFDALRGIVPKYTRRRGSAINEEYPVARAKALRWLFADINFLQPYRDETAYIVADRIHEQSDLLRFLGIASTSKKPTGQPTRLMNKVLKNIGLTVKETQKCRVNCGDEISIGQISKGNPIKRFYAVTPDSYKKLQLLADQRNRGRETVTLGEAWASEQAPDLLQLH